MTRAELLTLGRVFERLLNEQRTTVVLDGDRGSDGTLLVPRLSVRGSVHISSGEAIDVLGAVR